MGINIQITDANFTYSLGVAVPYNENALGYWNFRAGLEKGLINQVTNIKGTKFNNPTVLNNTLLTNKDNGFITDVIADGEKTFITVAEYQGSAILVGSINYDTVGTMARVNDGIAVDKDSFLVQVDRASGARTSKTTSPKTENTPYFIAGTLSNSESKLYNSDGSGMEVISAASLNMASDEYPIRIGGWSNLGATFAGNLKIYATLIYDRVLTESEITVVYEHLKDKLNLFNV